MVIIPVRSGSGSYLSCRRQAMHGKQTSSFRGPLYSGFVPNSNPCVFLAIRFPMVYPGRHSGRHRCAGRRDLCRGIPCHPEDRSDLRHRGRCHSADRRHRKKDAETGILTSGLTMENNTGLWTVPEACFLLCNRYTQANELTARIARSKNTESDSNCGRLPTSGSIMNPAPGAAAASCTDPGRNPI